MPKFVTLTPIKFSADEITPEGAEVELSAKDAKPLLEAGALREPAKTEKAERNGGKK